MPQDVRLWAIQKGDKLEEIHCSRLDIEERIENWLEEDISIISDDLIVIGRQVQTAFGGIIDLFCLDSNGDVVIIELKREKTPREITAQVLDYASWVKDLSNERITEIADRYLGGEDYLENAFSKRFDIELPEILNEHHKMLVVASEVDSSSERIINYLSDTGIAINAVTFQYFCDQDGKEFLARVFLIEPSQVEYKSQTKTTSKREPPLTYEQLQEIADSNGVGELYQQLVNRLTDYFDYRTTTRSTVGYIGIIDGSRNTIFSVVPGRSNAENGVRFWIYIERMLKYMEAQKNELIKILPPELVEAEHYSGGPMTWYGYFKDVEQIDKFLKGLDK